MIYILYIILLWITGMVASACMLRLINKILIKKNTRLDTDDIQVAIVFWPITIIANTITLILFITELFVTKLITFSQN
jgi:hypothetical protein